MSGNTEIAMQELYRDSLKEKTVRILSKDSDWTVFRAIQENAAKHLKEERESYRSDYAGRVDNVRRELIKKAGSKTFEHPTPFGVDKFNPDRINREAQRIVRNRHAQKMATILNVETSGYEALCERIQTRDQVKDLARDEFKRSVDRRTGQERRATGPKM